MISPMVVAGQIDVFPLMRPGVGERLVIRPINHKPFR